jgi:hypothetical protein
MTGSRTSLQIAIVSTLVVVGVLYVLLIMPLLAVRSDLHRMAEGMKVSTAAEAPLTQKESTELKTTLYATDVSAVGAILSFVSVLAALVTILFVVSQTQALSTQTRHITESLRQASTTALTERNFALHQLFIENAHLRPYFYDGEPIASTKDEHYLQALAVAGYLLDSFYFLIHETRKAQIAVGADISEEWFEPYIRNSFQQSDVLCAYFDAHEDWFAMDEAGKKLKELRGRHHHPPKTRVTKAAEAGA